MVLLHLSHGAKQFFNLLLGREAWQTSKCSKGCWPHSQPILSPPTLFRSQQTSWTGRSVREMHSKEKKIEFYSNLIFTSPANKTFQPISLLLPARAKLLVQQNPRQEKSSAESLQSHLSPLWALSSQSLSRGLNHWQREFWAGMALNLFCLWQGWVFSCISEHQNCFSEKQLVRKMPNFSINSSSSPGF